MAPVILALKGIDGLEVHVLNTGQHKDLLEGVLEIFNVKADSSLTLMEPGQSLARLTAKALEKLEESLIDLKPNLVLVHGDTSTALAAGLGAFYLGIPVGHVEAGLRTGNLQAPFPEEMNRQVLATLSDLNFAPTQLAANNLVKEGVELKKIHVTGNTVVDSCVSVFSEYLCNTSWVTGAMDNLRQLNSEIDWERRLVLVTLHRRENRGENFESVLSAVRDLALEHPDVNFVFPVHPNPIIKDVAQARLGDLRTMFLTKPLDYLTFSLLLSRCDLAISDSGGIQEEGVTFGTRVLVAREDTERPEGLDSGFLRLVGSDSDLIRQEGRAALQHRKGTEASLNLEANPYGDGTAAKRIAEACRTFLGL